VLHSEEPGRAVLVALEAGQELGDHQVKEHAWVLVADGSVVVESGGERVDAGTGTLLHFEPDERHAVAAQDGGARLLLLLAPWPGEGHYRNS
jgi:quercetin dioxygenase-like cupin family protein